MNADRRRFAEQMCVQWILKGLAIKIHKLCGISYSAAFSRTVVDKANHVPFLEEVETALARANAAAVWDYTRSR